MISTFLISSLFDAVSRLQSLLSRCNSNCGAVVRNVENQDPNGTSESFTAEGKGNIEEPGGNEFTHDGKSVQLNKKVGKEIFVKKLIKTLRKSF